MTLACRVVINLDRIDVKISRHRLASLLTRQSMDPPIHDQGLDHAANDVVTLAVPACLREVDFWPEIIPPQFSEARTRLILSAALRAGANSMSDEGSCKQVRD